MSIVGKASLCVDTSLSLLLSSAAARLNDSSLTEFLDTVFGPDGLALGASCNLKEFRSIIGGLSCNPATAGDVGRDKVPSLSEPLRRLIGSSNSVEALRPNS